MATPDRAKPWINRKEEGEEEKKRWGNEPAEGVWFAAFSTCMRGSMCDLALELLLLEAADES